MAEPLEAAGCLLAGAAAAPDCAGVRLPRSVRRGIARSRAAITRAVNTTNPTKHAKRLAQAKGRLGKLSAAIDRAAAKKRHPLAAACAAALHALVSEAQSRLASAG